MKVWFRKNFKVISSVLAGFVNTVGFCLSLLGVMKLETLESNSILILVLLGISEIFLILTVIYTLSCIIKDAHRNEAYEFKQAELLQIKAANKVIFENYKTTVLTYKDFRDRLHALRNGLNNELKNINELDKLVTNDHSVKPSDEEITNLIDENRNNIMSKFEDALVRQYNRFMVNMLNLLKSSVDEYLSTKGCNSQTSFAIKQLKVPVSYKKINEREKNIYTAFRDPRTYNSKKRKETWDKLFCIRENSDFRNSVERDYYIFNFISKSDVDNSLYQNENENFYEYYNSGVTCAIYSHINDEKRLYGFLACDSLFDTKIKEKCGNNVYDYNVASIMLATAHIISLYLDSFIPIWDDSTTQGTSGNGICETMAKRVENLRYN